MTVPFERRHARKQLVEQTSKGVQVAAYRTIALGRHVLDRPEHGVGRSHPSQVRRPRHSEVRELQRPVARDEYIGGLHVPVNDSAPVDCRERLTKVERDLANPAPGQRTLLLHDLAKGPAVNVLHRDVRSSLVPSIADHANDMR